jgi:hypothetical protein
MPRNEFVNLSRAARLCNRTDSKSDETSLAKNILYLSRSGLWQHQWLEWEVGFDGLIVFQFQGLKLLAFLGIRSFPIIVDALLDPYRIYN